MASLDATKAFDRVHRVHHVKLFQKLIYKGLPGGIIKILVDWYGKTFSIVKWNNSYSSSYSIKSGIRKERYCHRFDLTYIWIQLLLPLNRLIMDVIWEVCILDV